RSWTAPLFVAPPASLRRLLTTNRSSSRAAPRGTPTQVRPCPRARSDTILATGGTGSRSAAGHPETPMTQTPKKSTLRAVLSAFGPGIVTGAADDDPSGIATYSIAGAQLGTSLLWTALLTWPLMAAVQMTCARIGMVTGEGLAGAMGKKFPKWFLVCVSVALLLANTVNIAADLSGMSDA